MYKEIYSFGIIICSIILIIVVYNLFFKRIFESFTYQFKKSPIPDVKESDSQDRESVIISFIQFSEKEVNDLYNFLNPNFNNPIHLSTTLYGELGIDSAILPAKIKSSYQKTIEKQIALPTSLFKYIYCIKKLELQGDLVMIHGKIKNEPKLQEFNRLIENLKQYPKIQISENQIKEQVEYIKQQSIEVPLVEKLKNNENLNCFFNEYKFFINKDGDSFTLLSRKADNGIINISVMVQDLTQSGTTRLSAHIGHRQSFTIFGNAFFTEDPSGEESISITPYAIF